MNYTVDDFQVGDILFSNSWNCEYQVMSIHPQGLVIRALNGGRDLTWDGYLYMDKTRNKIQIRKQLKKEERILAKIALIEKRWKER